MEITKVPVSIYYKLVYQPSGTVQKILDFSADNDNHAVDRANEFCQEYEAELISLRKITEEKFVGYFRR